jgi:hypothetical protein
MGELKITQIFSASDVKHGVSLFTNEEIKEIEKIDYRAGWEILYQMSD